jgi:hypothetical protein
MKVTGSGGYGTGTWNQSNLQLGSRIDIETTLKKIETKINPLKFLRTKSDDSSSNLRTEKH